MLKQSKHSKSPSNPAGPGLGKAPEGQSRPWDTSESDRDSRERWNARVAGRSAASRSTPMPRRSTSRDLPDPLDYAGLGLGLSCRNSAINDEGTNFKNLTFLETKIIDNGRVLHALYHSQYDHTKKKTFLISLGYTFDPNAPNFAAEDLATAKCRWRAFLTWGEDPEPPIKAICPSDFCDSTTVALEALLAKTAMAIEFEVKKGRFPVKLPVLKNPTGCLKASSEGKQSETDAQTEDHEEDNTKHKKSAKDDAKHGKSGREMLKRVSFDEGEMAG